MLDLSNPSPVVAGRAWLEPGPLEEDDAFGQLVEKATPSSWDWRKRGIIPPVRNQGNCGSCWAFGTVGITEPAIKKAGGPLTDLSEQFLVSCNNEGYDCNGGWWVHEYHWNVLGIKQTKPGAVLESAKPYTATDGTCGAAYNHPNKINNWKYVNGGWWDLPTVSQLKNAIYTYGPVGVTLCVGNAFRRYTGGVFSTDESSLCDGSVNHAIVLVGWNDNTQTWILRNSWGSGWGEKGYMNIRWGKSGVGMGATWVTVASTWTPAVPSKISPKGDITTTRPAYKWTKSNGATSYGLTIYSVSKAAYTKYTVSSSYCGVTTCSYTPNSTLSKGNYKWKVNAKNSSGTSTYSSYQLFTVK